LVESIVLALVYDGTLTLATGHAAPPVAEGDSLVRVLLAGICATDLEIVRGYAGFRGILGHEFVGRVEESADPALMGCRVVGDINVSCGLCRNCRRGFPSHCVRRAVLGIRDHNGAFAEFLRLPRSNLHAVPCAVSDEAAVFTEPLAAALQICEQVHVKPTDRVVVVGDGRLGLLAAQVLRLTGCSLLVVGKHPQKLAVPAGLGIETMLVTDTSEISADIVVECTGQPSGLDLARALVRPRGVIVLKSTFHGAAPVALSGYVVDEVSIVGSRCGPFVAALRLLQSQLIKLDSMVSSTYALADGVTAMEQAAQPGVLKVLLKP
jgi:threonine dehydrogenase-like Zn-dependent dehydrogenase